MNRNICNLQNYLNNLNVRNTIEVKNAMKEIESVKVDELKRLFNENELINDKFNFETFKVDRSQELVIKKNINFKMLTKPHHPVNNNISKKKENVRVYKKVHKAEVFDTVEINKKKKITLEILEPMKGISCQGINDDYELNSTINNQINAQFDSNGLNEFRNDLQSFFTQMALSTNTNHFEDHMADNNEKNYDQAIAARKEKNIELSESLSIIGFHTDVKVRHKFLSKKYVRKWKMYLEQKRKIKKRQETVNFFLNKLAVKKKNGNQSLESVKKAKLQSQDYNTFQHRYKVQQNIIALQKIKLNEQSKVIEQLKYNKLIESSKQSLEAMREEICNSYYQIDRQLKPKIKCLSNDLKIRELNEPEFVLHCLKVPQFIQRMEKRAREREEKHAMIRERRRQMEEERIRLKQQFELAKAEMDKEEKIKRIKELREKRKKEKIDNIRKKQHAERMRALIVMADLHYEKNLMAKYGINPLRRLLAIKRDNIEKAKHHFLFQLKKNVFLHWMWHTEDMWFNRNYKAEEFYRKKILSRTFQSFKKNLKEYEIKLQVAEDYYDLYLIQLAFRKFRNGLDVIKKEFQVKWYKSELYYNSTLIFKTFTCWRTLPALNALRREQEVRKQRWRQKVLQVVPDYKPPQE